jgi:hypothetical protein
MAQLPAPPMRPAYRLGVDDGGRPVVDDGGRLVYVKITEEDTTLLEDGQARVIHPGKVDPSILHPENTTPQAAADTTMVEGDDPAAFTVDQVTAYLATATEAEVQRVMDAEEAGKARVGILSWTA